MGLKEIDKKCLLAREEARRRMIEVLEDNHLAIRFTAHFEIDGTGYFFAPNGMRDGHGGDHPIRVKMVVARKMAAAGGDVAGEDA